MEWGGEGGGPGRPTGLEARSPSSQANRTSGADTPQQI